MITYPDIQSALADYLRRLYPTGQITLVAPDDHPDQLHALTLVEQGVSLHFTLSPFPRVNPITARLRVATAWGQWGGARWPFAWHKLTARIDGLLIAALAHEEAARTRTARQAALTLATESLQKRIAGAGRLIPRIGATGQATFTLVRRADNPESLLRMWTHLPTRLRAQAVVTGSITFRGLSRDDVESAIRDLH